VSLRARVAFPVLLLVAGCSRKPEAPAPPPPATRIVLGGDVMLSRHVGRLARQHKDPAFSFRTLAPYLKAADIAFVNLESPFSDRGTPVEKGMIFKAEPSMVEGLVLAGIDVVSTANNHARDQGSHGLDFTVGWLGRHGIQAVGTTAGGQGVVLERNGVRFGFLAYTWDQLNGNHPKLDERVQMLDISRITESVARLRLRADVVIVSMHAGGEYSPRANRQQTDFARAAIDSGASVVAGHHPHVVQPVERYRDGVIFYSLGNLVFDQFQRAETQRGLLGEVVFRGARFESFQAIPLRIRNTVPEIAVLR
jgi:poly-gamma-glutamate synthesis protein (capsule biosynthesis protein)